MQHRVLLVLCSIVACSLLIFEAQGQDVENISEEEPIEFTGSASINTGFYDMRGMTPRRQPYNYSLRFSPTLQLYGLSMPFSLVLNKQGTNFSQPFNQFGMSPEYKWAELHLGYRRMSFSPFTLQSKTFAGGGIELNPGKFRFGAFYGRINRASSRATGNIPQPQFKRMAYGGKIGVGTDEEYFDLIFFKAKDRLGSLSGKPDSLTRGIPARENMVVGISSRVTFFGDLISWKIDAGGSAFTRDIRQEKIDVSDTEVPDVVTDLYTPRISSIFNWSGETSLMLNLKSFSIGGSYRRVNPDYRTLGINYINDDVENITLNTSFSLWENQLNISGSYGIQKNNLNQKQTSRTDRTIGSVNLNFNPSSVFGITMQYSNFNIDQVVVRDTVIMDSMLVDQVNHNLNVFPRFTFVSGNHIHNIVLGGTYQKLQDQNFADNKILNGNLNYGLTFTNVGLTLNTGFNYQKMDRGDFTNSRYGFSLSGRKSFFDNKFSLRLSGTYNINKRNQEQGTLINSRINASYHLSNRQSLNVSFSIVNRSIQSNKFTEMRGNVGYRISF